MRFTDSSVCNCVLRADQTRTVGQFDPDRLFSLFRRLVFKVQGNFTLKTVKPKVL